MKTKLFFVSAILVVLAACTVTTRVPAPSSAVDVVLYEKIPLAPNVMLTIETPVIAPGSDYVWIDGFYTWDARHRDYVWVQGHWEMVPYTGAYWIPGYWEYYRNGYRWVNACWLPRNYHLNYGYYNGRYDYYGRPVYYPKPNVRAGAGYSYAYDHRPEYRGRGYNSSSQFNNMPQRERDNIRKEYRTSSSAGASTRSTRSASTSNNRQESIRIREDNQGRSSRQPAVTPDTNNIRQQNTENNNNASGTRSTQSTRSSETPSSSTRSSATPSTETRSSGSSTTTRSSAGSSRSSSSPAQSGSSSGSSSRSSSSGRR